MAQVSEKPERGKPDKITVTLPDEWSFLTVRTILTYESEIRGLTVGQTCTEMLLEAVDIESYPEEVRQRLAEIREAARVKAVQKSLDMTN